MAKNMQPTPFQNGLHKLDGFQHYRKGKDVFASASTCEEVAKFAEKVLAQHGFSDKA